ncbi:hypothetical protein ACUH7Y_19300 [Clostridium beijerinckii]|uniref:DUF4203 domain-containing protein n=1 Tax=Clostridium beijerinckii TaxID=1520 RepID=A0A7X9SS81_CLOBE|nr:hypothetical protein [Clostridium beijerinckii]NMF07117.1 hypothetical protein [Clostridium beijerinckii]
MDTIDLIRNINNLLGDPAGLERSFREISVGIAAIAFLFNTIQCFFGYKLAKLWISISGVLLFGLIGFGIGVASGSKDGAIVWALVFAIIGAFIAFKLYRIGVFILAFIGGLILGILLFNAISLGVILGVILGVLSLILMKPVIIISTAVPAGMMAGKSLVIIFGSNNKGLGITLGIIYAIAGIAVQWITNKNDKIKAPQASLAATNSSLNSENIQSNGENVENKIVETMSEMITQANNNINDNVSKAKQKLEEEIAKASEEAKGLTILEVLTELKSIFYSSKIFKYIILYCEIIMYYLAVQEIIATYSNTRSYIGLSWQISKIGALIALFIGVIAFSKKKYFSVIAYYSIASITYIIKFLSISKYNFNIEQLVYTLVIIGINILTMKLFFKTEEGIQFKKKASKLFSNTSTLISNSNETVKTKIMVRCSKCGKLCDETDKFCGGCGNQISILGVGDKKSNEELDL